MQPAIKIKKAQAILSKHKWVRDPNGNGAYLKDVDDLHQYIKTAEASGAKHHSLDATFDEMTSVIKAKSDAVVAELAAVLDEGELKALTYTRIGCLFTPLSPKRIDVPNVAVYGWLADAAVAPKGRSPKP